jgi:hypothetical protein
VLARRELWFALGFGNHRFFSHAFLLSWLVAQMSLLTEVTQPHFRVALLARGFYFALKGKPISFNSS